MPIGDSQPPYGIHTVMNRTFFAFFVNPIRSFPTNSLLDVFYVERIIHMSPLRHLDSIWIPQEDQQWVKPLLNSQ